MSAGLVDTVESLPTGPVTDFANFMGAVIDDRAFAKHKLALARAHATRVDHGRRRWQLRRLRGLVRRSRPCWSGTTRPTRSSPPSTSGRSCRCTCSPTGSTRRCVDQMESAAAYALTGSIIATDRAAIVDAAAAAALRGWQLLRQRQADRCGRGSAALRRRPRVGDQRQGRRDAEPAALDVDAVDQGDVRAAGRPRLPAHGRAALTPRLRTAQDR